MVDTVVITSPPVSAPEGHDQAMIDLVDKTNQPPAGDETLENAQNNAGQEDRPDWLPEKFKTPEEMAKSYAELESKLGSNKQGEQPAENTVDPANADQKAAEEALSTKGLDLSEFSNEFNQKGELSPESYEKLTKAGFDKDLVDQFIEGQKARASLFEADIVNSVGGREKYGDMVEWAKVNMSESEINAFNSALAGGQDQAKLAVAGLKSRYDSANGSDPRLLSGSTKGGQLGDVFESHAQVTEAMRDPRYKSDPAYRSKVQSKLARSNVF